MTITEPIPSSHSCEESQYDIICGSPDFVASVIQQMLKTGWELNGELLPYESDGKRHLVAQGIVRKRETD